MPQDEKRVGPIHFTAQGQEYTESCRIVRIIWRGATTAGDQVTIMGRGSNSNVILWPCRTDGTNTYLGVVFAIPGVHAPDGFRATELASGEVFVYLAE